MNIYSEWHSILASGDKNRKKHAHKSKKASEREKEKYREIENGS